MQQHRGRARVMKGALGALGALSIALTTACSAAPDTAATAATKVSITAAGTSPSTSTPAAPTRSTSVPTTAPSTRPVTAPTTSASPKPSPRSSPKTVSSPKPSPTPSKTSAPAEPAPPAKIILRPGNTGTMVRSLQARLRQIGWFTGDVSDVYGTRTTASVRGFQAKRGLDATGVLDETTWNRLLAMTRRPTSDELNNVKPKPKPKPAAPTPTTPTKPKPKPAKPAGMSWDQDARCMTGRVMCISKSTRTLTWVIDGQPQYQLTVRFGSADLPTREGAFSVYRKAREIRSNIDQSLMPFSMFFSGGEAVHYSPNFARVGYNGNSHGCVNVRDWNGIARLYAAVNVGDKVVVHW